MECYNCMCIYNKDDECLLDEIEIDETGTCSQIIYPDIPEDIVEAEKEKLRKSFGE